MSLVVDDPPSGVEQYGGWPVIFGEKERPYFSNSGILLGGPTTRLNEPELSQDMG
jgi:hypothetical protein